ncbi:MAG: acetyl-CoA carboxylase biotin carboxyl carrier protein [Candidatus Korobacteraceae bacterium]|jgi:acetyl-CoA carboxylase biotin carboxyl carrier protein
MNQKEIKELIDLLVEKDIAEFELERGDTKIRIKRTQQAVAVSGAVFSAAPPVALPPPAPPSVPAAAGEEGVDLIKSPIVGTFYEASSPGAPAFVKQGDTVTVGQVLCIVEAMKLLNEIESETAGEIVEILVANGQPVEYGQPLFKVRTK